MELRESNKLVSKVILGLSVALLAVCCSELCEM